MSEALRGRARDVRTQLGRGLPGKDEVLEHVVVVLLSGLHLRRDVAGVD